MEVIRSHWGIENILHRSLDVFFKEDACQVGEKMGAENLSMLRKLSGSMLHKIDPQKTLKLKAMLGSGTFRRNCKNNCVNEKMLRKNNVDFTQG